MAAGSGNSAAGVLTQLSEASNLSSDEQARTMKLMIPLLLFHLPQPARC